MARRGWPITNELGGLLIETVVGLSVFGVLGTAVPSSVQTGSLTLENTMGAADRA